MSRLIRPLAACVALFGVVLLCDGPAQGQFGRPTYKPPPRPPPTHFEEPYRPPLHFEERFGPSPYNRSPYHGPTTNPAEQFHLQPQHQWEAQFRLQQQRQWEMELHLQQQRQAELGR